MNITYRPKISKELILIPVDNMLDQTQLKNPNKKRVRLSELSKDSKYNLHFVPEEHVVGRIYMTVTRNGIPEIAARSENEGARIFYEEVRGVKK